MPSHTRGLTLDLDAALKGIVMFGWLEAEGLSGEPLGEAFTAERDASIRELMRRSMGRSAADLPGVAETRGMFHRLGVDPTKTRPSSEALLRRVPELDLVMGPQHANRLDTLLARVETGQQVVATDEQHILEDITTARRDSKVCAWVNVIYGCNERCTYCVVPSVRGKEQSRLPEAIRLEMEGLAAQGFKEITLLGQNIDAYGRDLPGITPEGRRQHTLTDLLQAVHDVEGIERIRFATSHPRYFTERLIDACADLEKVCEHFHIPFQSGDDAVLKAMARGYTVDRYRRIIERIRERMPDAAISADVIVAFPGETDAQYRRTLELVEEIGFDQVNTAAYSPRPNTPAADWPDQLPEDVKVDRLQELNTLVERKARERSARYAGRIEQILVEGTNPKDPEQVMGRTRTNRLTRSPTTRLRQTTQLAIHLLLQTTYVHAQLLQHRTNQTVLLNNQGLQQMQRTQNPMLTLLR